MDSFAALSDPSRRSIIEMLTLKGELSAGEIGGHFEFTAPALSKHLKILREAGLVEMEKRAQSRVYSARPQGMRELSEWVERMNKFWSPRIDRLEKLLRDEDKTTKTERKLWP
ncbi:MAG: metalloregulator ArsR/SmtB family transcription factor [Alphaproteobacteria bacterium]